MIKTDNHNWYVTVLSNGMPNLIIDYEQGFISYKVYSLRSST